MPIVPGTVRTTERKVIIMKKIISMLLSLILMTTAAFAAADIVKRNPYLLCDTISGIGFERADAIARSIGIDVHSHFRIECGMKYILKNNLNRNGNCYTLEDGGLSALSYTDPFDLHIDRIQESNGYLYISITGTSATRLSRVVSWCNGYLHSAEDSWLGSEILSGLNYGIPKDELAHRVRACYRAFLLVCDPATMEILSVTVMDGAYPTEHQGSAIPSIETDADGHILWVVESPYATIYSPFTSSFSMAGDSYRYTFTLTPEGKVVGTPVIQTGIGYRR